MYLKYWICYNIENQTSCETFILLCWCEITILIKMFPHSIKNQKTVSIYSTQEKFAFGSKNELILIQFYLRRENMFWKIEERFIIDRRALILSEKRFPRNPLALLLILFCFWLNPISGLKSNNRWEGKELSLETHFLSSLWSTDHHLSVFDEQKVYLRSAPMQIFSSSFWLNPI